MFETKGKPKCSLRQQQNVFDLRNYIFRRMHMTIKEYYNQMTLLLIRGNR